ncbi:ATP-binding cassette domain-containing protein [Porphyromonadaceae bacterium OttesenSCG-928-L07]|nr:ATP-binding cassette domain-containing protein [Porphyromonadaceae bacterium OttesenSCG-928-L07]MDL2251675.1 ATP-binding cassette domain-containing protein [Odoribacter sp. OttesenSCG-928-J03]MDL2330988.1 ATP-binding cassette domain-containing protein [Odoribacter sp. OttesenSCG-928-A06]
MSIKVEHISKNYGEQKALNDVSFSLAKGEICGFLGPNGAGKSTMMKIITGYLSEFEGEAFVDGVDVRKDPIAAKRLIGYLPEHNPIYPEMYIREYLEYVARLYKIKNVSKKVGEVIAATGLQPEINKKIGQLSKGYRQRVGLAQALVHDPEVLILDEPMTGLDPNQLEEIRNLIVEVGRNKTVMLSTHIMQEVEAICNRVIIIDKGNVVADKPKGAFQRESKGLFIQVRFATDTDEDWLNQIEGVESVRRMAPALFYITSKQGADPRVALFHAAAGNASPIIELKTEDQNLEGLFRDLTLHP